MIFRGRDRWDYTHPERLIYSWRIDGAAWSALQTDNVAPLTGVASGSHTFEVRAVDRNCRSWRRSADWLAASPTISTIS